MIMKKHFRWLLVVYCIAVILEIALSLALESVIPTAVREIEPSISKQSQPLLLLLFGFSVAVLVGGAIGLIGMFFFWPPSRYIFLVCVLLKILSTPLHGPWIANIAVVEMIVGIEILLGGAILALCLFGPGKHFFEKMESNNIIEEISR